MAVALVTGASRGIGLAVAIRLAKEGYAVAGCCSADNPALHEAEHAVAHLGTPTFFGVCDVRDGSAVETWIKDAELVLGDIDLLVNNAGIARDAPLVLSSQQDWDDTLSINLGGTRNTCRALAFRFMKRKSGCIVNLSSVAGIAGNAGQTSYAASKAGIIGFSKSLAKELARYGIRVNVVAPGFIETDMTAALNAKQRDQALSQIGMGRYGEPNDVADAVLFLASSQATYITGQVLQVDGGISL